MADAKRAVIVGVNEYEDKSIPALKGAEKDAEEVKNLLTKQGEFEVAPEDFLIGKDATYENVRRALSDLLWKTDPSPVSLFYFSGHGFQDSYGAGYIAPWDMEKQRPFVKGIDMQGVKQLALQSKQKDAVVLILDCCYAGVAADEKGLSEALGTAEKAFSGMSGMFESAEKAAEVATGVFVFSSSANDQTSRELLNCCHTLGTGEPHAHGAFTFHLIEGLSGLATSEPGGSISVAALRDHISKHLKNNPNQTFKLYSSRETNSEGIILCRASDMERLIGILAGIEQKLTSGHFRELILSATELSAVLKECPNYGPAVTLRESLDNALGECKEKSRQWMYDNAVDWMKQDKSGYDAMMAFVIALSLDQIGDVRTKRVLGLYIELARIVQKEGTFKDLSPYLPKTEASRLQPSQLQTKLGTK
jgi:hypothetical protein